MSFRPAKVIQWDIVSEERKQNRVIILDLQSHLSEVLHSYQESRTRTKTRFLSCSQGFLSSLPARFEVALFFHFCYLRARSWNRMPLLGSTDWVAVLSSLLEHQLLTDPFFPQLSKNTLQLPTCPGTDFGLAAGWQEGCYSCSIHFGAQQGHRCLTLSC